MGEGGDRWILSNRGLFKSCNFLTITKYFTRALVYRALRSQLRRIKIVRFI